jgi:hypothetical protein
MALNDELLNLHEKLKYYSLETFKNIPPEPGVYAWLYPLRIKNRELKSFIEEINLVFNFYHDGGEEKKPKAEVDLGWRKYSIETDFKEISNSSSFLNEWKDLWLKAAETGEKNDIDKLQKIIFISSIFMPPLYIGKAIDLNVRCQQHIVGKSNIKENVFHNRFKNFATTHKLSCRNIEDLVFACISTKTFQLEEKKYENLIEKILMNLIKPIYSVR